MNTDPMVTAAVENTEGLKSGKGNLSKPQEVMVVDIAEELEGNQDEKEKMDCDTKNKNCLKKQRLN